MKRLAIIFIGLFFLAAGPAPNPPAPGSSTPFFAGVHLWSYNFASLPTERDGKLIYCTDCLNASVCAAGGAGVIAVGNNGSWNCNILGTPAAPPSGNGLLNPVTYGADPTGVLDSAAAFATTIATACTNKTDIGVPAGTFRLITQPILDKCSSGLFTPSIYGSGTNATTIKNGMNGGSSFNYRASTIEIAASNITSDVSVVTGLFGTGNALNFGNSKRNGFIINESTSPACCVTSAPIFNGYTAFTVRAVIKPTTVGINQLIITSEGVSANSINPCGFGLVGGCKKLFALGLDSSNHLYCSFKTTTTGWQENHGSVALSINNTYEVQLDYDGSFLRCFHGATGGGNMTMDGKLAQTGTLVQGYDETTTLGYGSATFFNFNDGAHWNGIIDTVEISNIARCGSDTCPSISAQIVKDNNSIFLVNWDHTALLPLVQTDDNQGGWLMLFNFNTNNGLPQSAPSFRDFSISGGTIGMHIEGVSAQVKNVSTVVADAPLYAIIGDVNASYLSSVKEGYLSGYDMSLEFVTGLVDVEDMRIVCSQADGVELQGPTFTGSYVLPASTCIYPILAGGTISLNDDELDIESGGTFPAVVASALSVSSPTNVAINRFKFLSSSGTIAPVLIDGTYQTVSIKNSQLTRSGTGPFVDVTNGRQTTLPAMSTITFENNSYNGNGEPSDTANETYATITDNLANTVAYTVFPGNAARTNTLNGTTQGSLLWSEPIENSNYKTVIAHLTAYENTTSTAQTVAYPQGFQVQEGVLTVWGSCTGVTSSNNTLTLPASMGAPQSGECLIIGR